MRTLKKRIKGLISIVLAICLTLQFNINTVFAEYTRTAVSNGFGADSEGDLSAGDKIAAGTGGGFIIVGGADLVSTYFTTSGTPGNYYRGAADKLSDLIGADETAAGANGLVSQGTFSRNLEVKSSPDYYVLHFNSTTNSELYQYTQGNWGNTAEVTITLEPLKYTIQYLDYYYSVQTSEEKEYNNSGISVKSGIETLPNDNWPYGHHPSGWETVYNDNLFPVTNNIIPVGALAKQRQSDGSPLIVQLTPVFASNSFKLTFDGNGGTVNYDPSDYTFLYMEGSDYYSLTDETAGAERPGFRFAGWSDTSDGTIPLDDIRMDFSNLENEKTVYAIWEPIPYEIRFNQNGGDGAMNNQIRIPSGTPTALNANQYTNVEHIFAGWATSASGPVEYADQGLVSFLANEIGQIFDLFAVWSKLYKVSFDGNGGSGEMDTIANLVEGVGTTLPASPFVKEGYTFEGWATSADATVAQYGDGASFTYSPSVAGETVVLYAVWKEVENPTDPIEPVPGPTPSDPIMVGIGNVHLNAGQAYYFGGDSAYRVNGGSTRYPYGTSFYVPSSGTYTISAY